MASISFTDAEGAVDLTNGLPGPGGRFRNWTLVDAIIGPIHEALGTGTPYVWEHREDQGATFELPYIPNTSQTECVRLLRHLKRGGLITVTPDDSLNAQYDCYIWPGSKPSLGPANAQDLRHVLSLAVLNTAPGEIMVCVYT